MLLDRPIVFSLLFPSLNPSLHDCMSLVRVAIPPHPCYLLINAVLCSALSIDLLATSVFPSKLLMFTSDVCIFPVVERLSSPSVYPVLSISCGLLRRVERSEYETEYKMALFPVPRSSFHYRYPLDPGTCIITMSLARLQDSPCTTNESPNPPLSLSWNVRPTRHNHQPGISINHVLSIYHMPTVAVTSFLSHFSTVLSCVFCISNRAIFLSLNIRLSLQPLRGKTRSIAALLFFFLFTLYLVVFHIQTLSFPFFSFSNPSIPGFSCSFSRIILFAWTYLRVKQLLHTLYQLTIPLFLFMSLAFCLDLTWLLLVLIPGHVYVLSGPLKLEPVQLSRC